MKQTSFVVVVLIIVGYALALKCPENEFWNDCGSACPRTCEEPNPPICTDVCVPQCDCNPGYLRNKHGICLPQESCIICPKNESWKDCASACPVTCEIREPGPCILICIRKCDCNDGYLRNSNGTCVLEKDC